MPKRALKVDSLLECIQAASRNRNTNAYQIAKATKLPLRSIQKLLTQKANPTLKNVHLILEGFGLSLYVIEDGVPDIMPRKRSPRSPDGQFSMSRVKGAIIREIQ